MLLNDKIELTILFHSYEKKTDEEYKRAIVFYGQTFESINSIINFLSLSDSSLGNNNKIDLGITISSNSDFDWFYDGYKTLFASI